MKLYTGLLWLVLVSTICLSARGQEEDDEVIIEEDNAPPEPEIELNKKPVYQSPTVKGNSYLAEPFDSATSYNKRWVKSQAKKDDIDAAIAKYDGEWSLEEPEDNPVEGDLTLVLKSKAKHHAISTKLEKPFHFVDKPFVMQYEVKFVNGQECGGAYVKLLTDDNLDLKKFTDKTGYTIMFGPDKCGNDHKLHFIFRHKNPVNGEFEEKHAKKPTATIDKFFSDKMTHLYTLVISPDNSFEIFVDQDLVNSGSLLDDMSPPVNPPKEIVDPEDKKPEDWDEREKIPDPESTKPDDWDEDEPEMLADTEAVKPDGWLDDEMELVPDPDADMPTDWDEDMDGEWEPPMIQNSLCENAPGCGEWEPPMIKNPLFKGKWRPPMMDNPEYKGKWKPRKIDNPAFFEDNEPYKMTSIGAVGLELWSMSSDIVFDNFLITDNKVTAEEFAADTWEVKSKQEKHGNSSGRSVVDAIMDATNERPWLWAVFVLVIILPLVLLIAYCCMPSKTEEPKARHPKKTDAPSQDDKETESEEEKKADEGADAGAGGEAVPAAKVTRSKAKKSDLEAEDENEADNEEDENKPAAAKSSPRKRKTKARKD